MSVNTFWNRSQSLSLYIRRGTYSGFLMVIVVVMRAWSESPLFSGSQDQFLVMVVACRPVKVRSGMVSRYLSALGKCLNVPGVFWGKPELLDLCD